MHAGAQKLSRTTLESKEGRTVVHVPACSDPNVIGNCHRCCALAPMPHIKRRHVAQGRSTAAGNEHGRTEGRNSHTGPQGGREW
jgi:hypothetical protein